tara:strand:+ start:434 stop:892 length:459 start_codon:yes stop_codon:yes gene_type:complete
MEYTESELDIICDSCCSIFLLIASSDNLIQQKEKEFFFDHYQDILSGLHIISDAREKAVLEFWAQDRFTAAHISELKNDSVERQMNRIRTGLELVQKKESEQDFLQYKKALLTLAINISKASRGLWGFGAQVSKRERKTLQKLSALLGIPLP